jgi:hypothetical protein
MPKLHLVAITPDNKGLVLSEQAESNRGDLVLDIDDRLLDAIDRAQRQRARDEGQKLSSKALPSKRESPEETGDRPSPRQIQDRVRAGDSVAAIAKSGGVDEEWVERFAAPVLAELEQVTKQARDLTFTKPRVGPSRTSLGASVAANVADRGAEMSDEEIESAWSASQQPGGDWILAFSLPVKGRRQKAEWTVDLARGELAARNKLATELGFREGATRAAAKPPAKPAAKPAARPASPPAAAPTVAEPVLAEPADAAGLGVTGLEVAAEEPKADDGIQRLPGTVDPTDELEVVLDSAGIAPAPPPPEADPTIEVNVAERPRPQPPTSSS